MLAGGDEGQREGGRKGARKEGMKDGREEGRKDGRTEGRRERGSEGAREGGREDCSSRVTTSSNNSNMQNNLINHNEAPCLPAQATMLDQQPGRSDILVARCRLLHRHKAGAAKRYI